MHISIFGCLVLAAAAFAPGNPLSAQQRPSPTLVPRVDTTPQARASGTIDGVVTDTNLVPLRGAFVSILRTRIRVGTGPNGRFRITQVPPGQYLLIVTRGGFSPTSVVVEVPATDTLRLAYTLLPAPVMLPGMAIEEKSATLRMREFDERRKFGSGEFMTGEQIERRNSVYATELFRNFPSINVGPSRTSPTTEYFALSRREGGSLGLQACPMTVYVDQVPMPTPFNLDLLPSPKSLAGIEVYSGPSTIPPQFAGFNRGCGVILVWTRDGY